MAYRIEITPTGLEALEAVTDRRSRDSIVRRIDALRTEPSKQGKPLRGELAGFMSIRAAGQRYRVIYKVDERDLKVRVYMIGIRKEGSRGDVYALAHRLVRRGLI